MTPSARLQAVLDLLIEIEKTPRPADALVSAYFRARRYIGSHDRAEISRLLYDILRHHARLGWWIERSLDGEDRISPSPLGGKGWDGGCGNTNSIPRLTPHLSFPSTYALRASADQVPDPPKPFGVGGQGGRDVVDSPRSQLLAYLALVEQKPLRDIENSFSGGKFSPAALADDEKKLLRKLDKHTIEHPEMPEEVKAECPEWAAIPLKQKFQKNFLREMQALLDPAPLDLRVNPLKTTREEILDQLKKSGFNALACPLSPYGIRIKDRPNLSALPMLKNGSVEIQDEGSQLVALAVDAKPGMRVVDFCAGAGGKTLAIAAEMQNKGRITACDVLEKRLTRSAERFRRAGLHNIEIKPLTSERDPWIKKHKGAFDRVLIDAPCTGVGAWRRNPDARWRSLGPGLEALVKLQAEILDSAARLVKSGGRLIYATCSLLPEENERQIEKFLEGHKEFRLIDFSKIWSSISAEQGRRDSLPLVGRVRVGGAQQGQSLEMEGQSSRNSPPPDLPHKGGGTPPALGEKYLSLTPLQHNTDGFFAAVMEKNT